MAKDLAHNQLVAHAGRELGAWKALNGDGSDYDSAVVTDVMALIHVFASQGHSGGSAPMILSMFRKLAGFGTLTPLLGTDDEFVQVSNDGIMQNRRNSAVFKREDGEYYYLDAIVWDDGAGHRFTGSASGISSAQKIKSFPFEPKTFVIKVNSKETQPDWWEHEVANMDDLKAVWEYYKQ